MCQHNSVINMLDSVLNLWSIIKWSGLVAFSAMQMVYYIIFN